MPLLENRYRVSPVCHEALPHSQRIARVPSWWVSSWEKPGRISRVALQEFSSGRPRSLVHLSISFPLLRRPSTVIIPLWVACWGETFHKLLMIMVVESFLSIDADIRSPLSLLLLSNCTPGILISITSVHRAYWSRGWYDGTLAIRLIIGRDFCCDSFFSWIVLRSFRHCFKAHCRTEMADIEQAQQMIPLITCEISFG